MKTQCAFAVKGVKAVHNEAAAMYVSEFLEKKWLKEIGYSFDARELDVISASAFVIIGSEIQELTSKGLDGKRSKNRTRSSG